VFEGDLEDLRGDPGQPGVSGPPGPAVCIYYHILNLNSWWFLNFKCLWKVEYF
jgi:hypothetical protein